MCIRDSNSTNGLAAIRDAEPYFTVDPDITNIAAGGATTLYPLGNSNSPTVSTSRYARLYQAGYAANILYLDIGSNDIHGGSSAATTWTAVQSILTNAKTLGYKTVVGTLLHESTETSPEGVQILSLIHI